MHSDPSFGLGPRASPEVFSMIPKPLCRHALLKEKHLAKLFVKLGLKM